MKVAPTATWVVAQALAAACGLAPLAAQAPEGAIERNVVYGMVGGAALLMDVHRPEEPNGVGLVWIWGSGWQADEPYGMGQLKNQLCYAFILIHFLKPQDMDILEGNIA